MLTDEMLLHLMTCSIAIILHQVHHTPTPILPALPAQLPLQLLQWGRQRRAFPIMATVSRVQQQQGSGSNMQQQQHCKRQIVSKKIVNNDVILWIYSTALRLENHYFHSLSIQLLLLLLWQPQQAHQHWQHRTLFTTFPYLVFMFPLRRWMKMSRNQNP